MPALAIGLGISGTFGYLGARSQAGNAAKAAALQERFAREGIDTLRGRTLDASQQLAPWQAAGQGTLDSIWNESGSEWGDSPLNRQFTLADMQADPGMAGMDVAGLNRTLQSEAYGPNADLNRRFTLADFEADPGYQFRLNEGLRGINADASARGLFNSGGTLKALEKYRQGYASNEFDKAYGRFTDQQDRRFDQLGFGQQTSLNELNRARSAFNNAQDRRFGQLADVAALGSSAASQRASLLAGEGGAELDAMTGIGNAQGAGQAARGAAYGNFFGNLGNDIGQVITLREILNRSRTRKPETISY